jgi:hypothetical protein
MASTGVVTMSLSLSIRSFLERWLPAARRRRFPPSDSPSGDVGNAAASSPLDCHPEQRHAPRRHGDPVQVLISARMHGPAYCGFLIEWHCPTSRMHKSGCLVRRDNVGQTDNRKLRPLFALFAPFVLLFLRFLLAYSKPGCAVIMLGVF